jgi:hypothetical protein
MVELAHEEEDSLEEANETEEEDLGEYAEGSSRR